MAESKSGSELRIGLGVSQRQAWDWKARQSMACDFNTRATTKIN